MSSIDGIPLSDSVRNCATAMYRYPASFVCPSEAPCTGIVLDNVNMTGDKDSMQCENAFGNSSEHVEPKSCLSSDQHY